MTIESGAVLDRLGILYCHLLVPTLVGLANFGELP